MSLFKKAAPTGERLKMLLYGAAGTGKTVTSLNFPNPVVIDTERGTEYYGEWFDFDRMMTSRPSEVEAAIDELLVDPQGYKTIIIDPVTALYDNIIDDQVTRQKAKTGNPNYVIQPLDYKHINARVKQLITKLLSLDMNVIVTAHEKVMYNSDKDKFMEVIGTSPEGPKKLPHIFDVVLHLTKGGDDESDFMAESTKDRTNKLPKEKFEFSYQAFVKFIGNENLEREPVVFNQQQNLNKRSGRDVEITFDGDTLMTAGIKAGTLMSLQELITGEVISQKALEAKLQADYMVNSLLDLQDDEGKLLLTEIQPN